MVQIQLQMRRIISKVVQTLFGRRKTAAKTGAPAKPEKPAAAAKPARPAGQEEPVVVKREQHTLSRSRIDEDALKVLNRLARYNHTAYLVGGGVRDLLLDRAVKDFDISTSAHPQEIKNLFRNCRLIGRRFRLAHILFKGGKVIEVSTFRSQTGFADEGELLIKSDNTFGTPEQDARRRDFTINGLFYNITDFSVIDYVGGLEDLQRRVIRTIGDPNIRLREDPIRTLRGIRLAARLGFSIEKGTRGAMTAHCEEIWKCAAPRIVDEFVRMLNQGAAAASFPLLAEFDLLSGLLPGFAKAYANPKLRAEIQHDLESLDAHQKPQGGLPAGLALAVLYYPLFAAAVAAAEADADRAQIAATLLDADLERLKFPRAQLEKAVLLLAAQQRLVQPVRRRGRAGSLASRPWFAEALTLFEITQTDTPEGQATLLQLRAQQHRQATERRPEARSAEGAEGPEESAEFPAPAPAHEEREGREGGRRRGRRRGRGRGRGLARPAEGQQEDSAPSERPERPERPEPRERPSAPPEREAPPARRQVVDTSEDLFNPDAAFGDNDTDLEPPGGAPPDSRTD